jgi:eukaryotic-like serine/threonine-protein kinase
MSEDTTAPDPAALTEPAGPDDPPSSEIVGFRLERRLGVGGMGEVVSAIEPELEREVAIKRLRTSEPAPDAVARFLREAKVQARLDHPAIVPVYRIGRDANDRPYFSMKRVAGVTLAKLLSDGRETLQRLLRAFVDVAQAIELAHTRGIVHRDLKPANIMLGDFGEVYVLDWGVARLLDEELEPEQSVLGTPGFMAPEQIERPATIGTAADVYALGAILFEILAGERLHPRDQALASTLAREHAPPSARRPDAPPELDALCLRALAYAPAQRPSARALADGVQAYLDGDRDLALRQRLAATAVADAHARLSANERAEAIRAAGRALALDPASHDAAALVTQLMLEPPATPPPELRADLDAAEAKRIAANARMGVWSYVVALVVPLPLAWNGLHSRATFAAYAALTAVLALTAGSIVRRPLHRERELWWYLIANALLVALVSRMCSPIVLAPAGAGVVAAGLLIYPSLGRRAMIVLAALIAGWLLPELLELVRVVGPSWQLGDDRLLVHATTFVIDAAYMPYLLIASGFTIAITGFHAARATQLHAAYEREILSQRWHYQQLIPRLTAVRDSP